MAGMGPPPKPAGQRRRTNPTVAMTKLPAEGRQGDPPPWPLGADILSAAKLRMLNEQIDDASVDAQGSDRAAKTAQRKLLRLREQVEVLEEIVESQASSEALLWAELWATPQAVVWERLRWTRDVAQYVRWKILAESGDLDASKESRQLSDRLGLNPLSLLRLRWEISTDEVGEQRTERTARQTSARSPGRRGLKAVDGA